MPKHWVLKTVAVLAVSVTTWAGCAVGGAYAGVDLVKQTHPGQKYAALEEVGGGVAGFMVGNSVGAGAAFLASVVTGVGLFRKEIRRQVRDFNGF